MGVTDLTSEYVVRDPLVIRLGETFDYTFVVRSLEDGSRIDLDGGMAYFQVRHIPGGYVLASASPPDTLRLQKDYIFDEKAGYSPVGVIRVILPVSETIPFRSGVYEVIAIDLAQRRYLVDRGAVRFVVPVFRSLT